ncbi:hypothetical protein JCM17380_21270 [Desulfosporosinus burensis]
MSGLTVVIIIWVIYQVGVSLMKKGKQQTPRNFPDPFKLPDGRSIKEAIQGASQGSWREQLKQALENGPYQAGSLESNKPMGFEENKEYYVETEGTQGIEGTQGVEGTSDYVGILGSKAYKNAEETPSEEWTRNPTGLCGASLALTKRELVQGVMWAEILGKPRAMRPFRGPRL